MAFGFPFLEKFSSASPIEAINDNDIKGHEESTIAMAGRGTYFALRIKGDSIEPNISDNNVLIVRKQSACNYNNVAVVLLNGNETTIKRITKMPEGIRIITDNTTTEEVRL